MSHMITEPSHAGSTPSSARATRRRALAVSLCAGLSLRCGDAGPDTGGSATASDSATTSGPASSSGSAATSTSAQTTGGASTSGAGSVTSGGTGDASTGSGTSAVMTGVTGPKFDVAAADAGETGGEEGPVIPETCAQAATAETTVGCLFYAVDLDQNGGLENDQYAIAVSNVQLDDQATVVIEQKVNGQWQEVAGPTVVEPLDLGIFPLPNNNQQGSGVKLDGSWRVTADVPIIAYQFNPLAAGAHSSDASMLYPVTSWDYFNLIVHWGEGYGRGYVTIVASTDDTVVEVTPSVATAGGAGVPPGGAGVPFEILLNEGEIAEVAVTNEHAQLTGTKIISDEEHPIAVFSGHECAWIPLDEVACDHVEEQLSGVRLWGSSFAAARVPVRELNQPETSLWQVVAAEDDTEVTIEAHADVTGLPVTPAILNQGEKLEFFAGGTVENPGDLIIEADKPIAVANYMTGFGNLPGTNLGDPAMVQLAPSEQFLPRYVVLVPNQWDNDVLVITRPAGAEVLLDGAPIDPAMFLPFGDAWEAGRVPVADGVHRLEGAAPFSVLVVGYDGADSYAYLGGSSTGKINPTPQG